MPAGTCAGTGLRARPGPAARHPLPPPPRRRAIGRPPSHAGRAPPPPRAGPEPGRGRRAIAPLRCAACADRSSCASPSASGTHEAGGGFDLDRPAANGERAGMRFPLLFAPLVAVAMPAEAHLSREEQAIAASVDRDADRTIALLERMVN